MRCIPAITDTVTRTAPAAACTTNVRSVPLVRIVEIMIAIPNISRMTIRIAAKMAFNVVLMA